MSFDPVAYLNDPQWHTMRPGLERIKELLERLDRPQDALRFVHVAGTNGKGSTCAYLEAMLRAAGYATGMFTSPYIEAFEERIRVNGVMINASDLLRETRAVRDAADTMTDHPTEYELMCAVALLHFARSGCDIVVLEVGLGGRLDATNAIDAPEVCVITRIGFDHTDVLGTTLSAIAREKAAIVKCGSAVVSWPQETEAMIEIEAASHACKADLIVPDFSAMEVKPLTLPRDKSVLGAQRCFSYGRFAAGTTLTTKLLASYQPYNALLALEAACALRTRGWNISDEAICAGIAQAVWPGRFEVVGIRPLSIVDGGHNPQGVHALIDTLQELLPDERPVFIVGVLADKDYLAMLDNIVMQGSGFVVFTPDNPRALPAEKLANALVRTGQDILGCSSCIRPIIASSAADAVEKARAATGEDGVVCACGSLYSVAALKSAFRT